MQISKIPSLTSYLFEDVSGVKSTIKSFERTKEYNFCFAHFEKMEI